MNLKLKKAVQRFGGAVVNPISKAILLNELPIPPLSTSTALIVEHVGRRTGQVRMNPMGFVVDASGDLLVVAEHGVRADWLKNADAAGHAVVHIGRDSFEVVAEPVPQADPYEVWSLMKSRSVAAFGKLLAHNPMVIRLRRSG